MKTQKLNFKAFSLKKETISDLSLNNITGGQNFGISVIICPNLQTVFTDLSTNNETENTLNGPILPKYPYQHTI